MQKLKYIPKNFVRKINVERFLNPMHYSYNDYNYDKEQNFQMRTNFSLEIIVEASGKEDEDFIRGIQNKGLEFVAENGFPVDKFKLVINQGYKRLPILMKHPDPEIQQIAWILSEYFANRNDIIPDKVIE